MKKSYIRPQVDVVSFVSEQAVLAGSSPIMSEEGFSLTLKDLGDEATW